MVSFTRLSSFPSLAFHPLLLAFVILFILSRGEDESDDGENLLRLQAIVSVAKSSHLELELELHHHRFAAVDDHHQLDDGGDGVGGGVAVVAVAVLHPLHRGSRWHCHLFLSVDYHLFYDLRLCVVVVVALAALVVLEPQRQLR